MFMLTRHVDVDTYYVPIPITCRLIKAQSAISVEALSAADGTVTFSDGTTTIGTITVTNSGNAEGDVDNMTVDGTSLGEVALGPTKPLKIVLSGNTNGELDLTMVFDEFHGAAV
jgi:hypothetical protein